MTSGWCSGDRVSSSRAASGGNHHGKDRFAGQAAITRGSLNVELPTERSLARMSWAGATKAVLAIRPPTALPRSRDAAGDAPRPWWHRPKTPAGRRGVSLFHSRTTASGQTPRRSRFTSSMRGRFFENSEAGWLSGASVCPDLTHPTGCHPSESWDPSIRLPGGELGPCFRRDDIELEEIDAGNGPY